MHEASVDLQCKSNKLNGLTALSRLLSVCRCLICLSEALCMPVFISNTGTAYVLKSD